MAKSKREFGEGPIYTITNYTFWLFMGNLYFLLMNIPLLYILLLFFANGTNPLPTGFTTIAIICSLPVGPAATALLSVMGKLVREKDINVTKDFFKAYKTNFFQSLFFWALEIVLISLLFIDIGFFRTSNYPQVINVFVLILIAFISLMSLYVFPLIARFYLGVKVILKTATYYTFRKPHITILNFASFLVVGFIFTKFSFIVLFSSSIICYLIMYYQQNILLEVEEKLKKNSKTAE